MALQKELEKSKFSAWPPGSAQIEALLHKLENGNAVESDVAEFRRLAGENCGLHTRLGAWMKQNMGALVPRNAPRGSSPGFKSNTPLASALQSWSF